MKLKLEKNKVVAGILLICIVLFLVAYSMTLLDNEDTPQIYINQIPIPELNENQKEYKTKLEALSDLKEVRQTNAPSIYDESLLDSTGIYDPDLLEKQKMSIVDSIYRHGRINYSGRSYRTTTINRPEKTTEIDAIGIIRKSKTIDIKQQALEHQLFFASSPGSSENLIIQNTGSNIYVVVNGAQTVKKNYRLKMRLINDALINGKMISKNTEIYGFVSFKPNRAMISIENIDHYPVKLKAYDLQDGSEGIYIENSFRAEATKEVIGDVVDDINISGVPQISGIKKIFQRSNRNTKVIIANNYKLVLKLKK